MIYFQRKAKIKEGDLLEVVVEADGTIRLLPRLAVDRALAEKYQLEDVAWALKQKEDKGWTGLLPPKIEYVYSADLSQKFNRKDIHRLR